MMWVAAIVVWGTVDWGLVHDVSLMECQRQSDAVTKQYNLERVDCISVKKSHLDAMLKLKVMWLEDNGKPVLYACSKRGCNETG